MTYGEDRVSAKVVVGFAGLLIAAGATTVFALPAKVENIEGSELKRVILDPKEAERLHIEMTGVREEKIVHRTVVLGQVEDERVAKAAIAAARLRQWCACSSASASPLSCWQNTGARTARRR